MTRVQQNGCGDRPVRRRPAARGRRRGRRLAPAGGPSTPQTRRTTASCRRRSSSRATWTRSLPRWTRVVSTASPLTARGAGTSTAGNAIGPGVVLDFSRHLNRVLPVDPRGPDGGRRARRDPRRHHRGRGAARAALRSRPVHARARHHRRLDRQQRLRIARPALRPHRRQRRRRSTCSPAPANGITARRHGRDGLPLPIRRRWPQIVDRDRLDLIRTEFGRFRRQVSGYSLEHLLPENGADLAKFLVGTEGTLGVITAGDRPSCRTAPAAAALAVLGYPDMPAAADAVPALLPHEPVALEGMDARLVDVVRSPAGSGRGAGPADAARAGCSSRRPARRSTRRVAAAEKLIADAGCLDSAVVTGARPARCGASARTAPVSAAARPRASRPGPAGRTPPSRRSSSAAYLREFDGIAALSTGLDGLVYGHFGDGCVHARIDFPLRGRPASLPRFRHGRRRGWSAATAGRCRASTATAAPAASCCRTCTRPRRSATFAAVKHALRPGRPAQPRRDRRRRPRSTPTCACRRLGRCGATWRSPTRHDGGDLSTAVHRCVGVGKCRADTTSTGGVMCPSYLATRDEKDSTRGRARVLQELANGSLVEGFALRRAGRVARPVPVLQGLLVATARPVSTWRPTRPRCCTSGTADGCGRASHYALGWLPRWARLASRAPRLANGDPAPLAGSRGVAKRLGGIDERRPLPQFAPHTFRQWFAHRPATHGHSGAALGRHLHRPLLARGRRRRPCGCSKHAGYSVRITDKPVCCGLTWISTGQLDGARRQLRRTLDVLTRAEHGSRSSGSNRPARPCCAAT